MRIPIAREGFWPITACIGFAALGLLLSSNAMMAVFLALAFLISMFFRDPERKTSDDDSSITSPADGKVIRIDEATSPFGTDKQRRVAIFMSVANVHVNRMPIAGRIEKIAYFPGRFKIASKKESEYNERNAMLIRSKSDSFTVVQIAGLVARRIICYLKEGVTATKGQRFGIIRFGSRVDLYLPGTCKILVNVGDKVVGGVTPIAMHGETR